MRLSAIDPTGETIINRSENSNLPSIMDSSGFAVTFQPGNFGIDELSKISFLWYDQSILPFVLSIDSYNNDIYNTYVISANLAYNFGDAYHMGFGAKYNQFIIKGFESNSRLNFNLAGKVNANTNLSAGFLYENVLGNKFNNSEINSETMQTLNLGIAWKLDEKLSIAFVSTVITKGESWYSASVRYNLNEDLQTFLMVYSSESRINFGVSFRLNEFLFNPEIDYHSKLGISQSYLIEYYY